MKKAVLVMIPEFAEWEAALLSAGLRRGFGIWEPSFDIFVAGPGLDPITSVGGLRVIPDYTFETVPDDADVLILVGGMSWFGPDAPRVLPLAKRAVERNILLGGICDASMFLGVNGFLNTVRHTSNSLPLLKERGGAAYTGEKLYDEKAQSVRDGTIVTANGVGFIEFARDVFTALEVAPSEKISEFYSTCKSGFINL